MAFLVATSVPPDRTPTVADSAVTRFPLVAESTDVRYSIQCFECLSAYVYHRPTMSW